MMIGPHEASRLALALVADGLRRILLCAPLESRRISPGLLDMAMASAIADEEANGGDMGKADTLSGSGSAIGAGKDDER